MREAVIFVFGMASRMASWAGISWFRAPDLRRSAVRALALVAALVAGGLGATAPAQAQYQPSLLSPPGSPPPLLNGRLGSPGASIVSPNGSLPRATAPSVLLPQAAQGQVSLQVAARYGAHDAFINGPLHWRVYADKPDSAGNFKLIKDEVAPYPTFLLPPGGYVVNVAFGLATATKAVQLRSQNVREPFDLPVGGIKVEGHVGNASIPKNQISFDIIKGSQFEPGEKKPVADNISTGDVVMLPPGTYHVVSSYGDANSIVRSDVRVQAGKLTDVTVNHRAAVITLKLVKQKGGEALVNTAWSVMTPGGDVVKESIGAFPRYVLAEGDYRVVARNEGQVFERGFKVVAGVDGEVEVVAH